MTSIFSTLQNGCGSESRKQEAAFSRQLQQKTFHSMLATFVSVRGVEDGFALYLVLFEAFFVSSLVENFRRFVLKY